MDKTRLVEYAERVDYIIITIIIWSVWHFSVPQLLFSIFMKLQAKYVNIAFNPQLIQNHSFLSISYTWKTSTWNTVSVDQTSHYL